MPADYNEQSPGVVCRNAASELHGNPACPTGDCDCVCHVGGECEFHHVCSCCDSCVCCDEGAQQVGPGEFRCCVCLPDAPLAPDLTATAPAPEVPRAR